MFQKWMRNMPIIVSTENKTCPYCGRKLGKQNGKGV